MECRKIQTRRDCWRSPWLTENITPIKCAKQQLLQQLAVAIKTSQNLSQNSTGYVLSLLPQVVAATAAIWHTIPCLVSDQFCLFRSLCKQSCNASSDKVCCMLCTQVVAVDVQCDQCMCWSHLIASAFLCALFCLGLPLSSSLVPAVAPPGKGAGVPVATN